MGNLVSGYLGREQGVYMRDQELVIFAIPPAILLLFAVMSFKESCPTPTFNSRAFTTFSSVLILFISALIFSVPLWMLAFTTDDFDTLWENVFTYGLAGLSIFVSFIVYFSFSSRKTSSPNDGLVLSGFRLVTPYIFIFLIYLGFGGIVTAYGKVEGFSSSSNMRYAKNPKTLSLDNVRRGVPSMLKTPLNKKSKNMNNTQCIANKQGFVKPFKMHEPSKYSMNFDNYNNFSASNIDGMNNNSNNMTVQDEEKLWELLEQQQEDNRYARIQFGYLNLRENEERRIKRN